MDERSDQRRGLIVLDSWNAIKGGTILGVGVTVEGTVS
jgi:hypothetical protein